MLIVFGKGFFPLVRSLLILSVVEKAQQKGPCVEDLATKVRNMHARCTYTHTSHAHHIHARTNTHPTQTRTLHIYAQRNTSTCEHCSMQRPTIVHLNNNVT